MEDLETRTNAVLETVLNLTAEYGLSVLGALVILVVGSWIAGRAQNMVIRALDRFGNIDQTLKPFLASLVKYAVLAIVLVAVLNQFGVQTASIIAILGAAGLAIGLALQGTLSNVAAGVMLLFLRPFKSGDFVEAGGHGGTVIQVGLFATELKTADGIFKAVPNSAIWSGTITNFSRNPTRRLDVIGSISYDDDVERAMAVLRQILEEDPRVLKEPAPLVFVAAMAASSVDIQVRGWVNVPDYWATVWDVTRRLKLDLEAAGFTIPFPQRDVHVVSKAAIG